MAFRSYKLLSRESENQENNVVRFVGCPDAGRVSCPYAFRCWAITVPIRLIRPSDPDGIIQVVDEDFSIADAARFGSPDDGLDDLVGVLGSHRHFDFQLGDKVNRVLGPAIGFGCPSVCRSLAPP